ncbi:21394_t:CDS:2 [Cetraspora pellucida]|uniref:21394_t:CDS:1 n=1 Tax=Cetraspora pellucida TaxID=1433469 RepID=A0A9N9I286_9GLOM|nr:21394_t:CDS:2 [Cetraspora pellucida]
MSNKDLFKKIDFLQKYEYSSLENKTDISKGQFGAICRAYLKDKDQTVALKTLCYYDDEKSLDNLIRKVKYTTEVNHDNIIKFFGITQETPIEGTPVDFKNLYCAAWDDKPGNRPDIKGICEKLDHMQLTPVYKKVSEKNAFRKQCKYSSFERKVEISKGGFGVTYKAYFKNEKQSVVLKTLGNDAEKSFYDFDREVKYTKDIIEFFGITQGIALGAYHVIKGNRETPIKGTPVDFENLYCTAWDDKPGSRPNIKEICKTLKNMQLKQLELFCNDFKIFEYTSFGELIKIDEGGFGAIYKACLKDTNQFLALKKILDDAENSFYDFVREVKCTTKVNNDYIIKFFGITRGTNERIKVCVGLIGDKREIPKKGTPIDFYNLYDAAWDGKPDSRPGIEEICNKLDHLRLEPVLGQVLYYSYIEFFKKCNC